MTFTGRMNYGSPYLEYKPGGKDWLGDIPAHWRLLRLKYVAKFSSEKLSEKPLGSVYIGLEQIEAGTGKLLLDEPVESVEGAVGVFKQGDILFGKLRPYLAKVVLVDFEGVCTTEALILRPKIDVDAKFLSRLLLSTGLIDLVNSYTYGTKMPRANPTQIGDIAVPLPPLHEQKAIVAFLDREVLKIDDLIAKRIRLITLLQEKRNALISRAVSKGVDSDCDLTETGVDWIGKMPSNWRIARIKHVARLESGHTPSRKHPEYWENCTIPWFGLADVWQIRDGRTEYVYDTNEKISELGLANSAARLLPAGTVMLSRTASVGFSSIMSVDMATTQDFVNWVCGPKIRPEYLLYVFRAMSSEFKRLVMGSTHQTIYMPDLERFVCPLPPVEEQDAIIEHIRRGTSKIDLLIDKMIRTIDLLKEKRSALITMAVTGKIDVRSYEIRNAQEPLQV